MPAASPFARTSVWTALLTAGMAAFIASFYGHVLEAPDRVLFTGTGDGLKNYFTFLWHVKHDASALHYSGSGYPFGDRVFYTDGHPLLSWVVRFAPSLADHGVGLLNTLMLAGLLLCAWCVFALLRELGLPPWAAAIGAFSITLLQPQVLRMGGHFSLAHAWMVPMVLFLAVRAAAREHWLYPGVLGAAVVLIAFLTHPYMGLMAVLFLVAHGACSALFGTWRWPAMRQVALRTVVMALLPMLLFIWLLGWGDTLADRPSAPLGADQYATRFLSLIVPTHDPFATPLREFFRYDRLDWETWCYLGLSTILVIAVAGGMQLRRWSAQGTRTPLDPAGVLLASAFLVLLFAMGIWQEWAGGWLPALAQFRGSGRFAWVFYHAAAAFAAVRLYHGLFHQPLVRRYAAVAAFTGVVGFMAVEGWAYHRHMRDVIGRSANPFRAEALNADQRALVEAIKGADAAAIIPLPWMHSGSERYSVSAPDGQLAFMLPMAYHSGVPLMAGLTSRTSLQQTRDLLALFAPLHFPKGLAERIPSDTRILLFRHWDDVPPHQESLWFRATHLYNNPEGNLRVITAGELLRNDRESRIEEHAQRAAAWPGLRGWRFSHRGEPAPEALMARIRFGADSLSGKVNEFAELLRLAPGELDTALTYELGFLYGCDDPAAININVILEHYMGERWDAQWESLHGIRGMPMQLGDRAAVASVVFKPRHPERTYRFILNGPAASDAPYVVRHVLLRPLDVDAWREGPWEGTRTVFLNNAPLSGARGSAAPR